MLRGLPHQHAPGHYMPRLSCELTCLGRCQVALQATALGGGRGCIRFRGGQLGAGGCVSIGLLRQAFRLRRILIVLRTLKMIEAQASCNLLLGCVRLLGVYGRPSTCSHSQAVPRYQEYVFFASRMLSGLS